MKDAFQSQMLPVSSGPAFLNEVDAWVDDFIFLVDTKFFVQLLSKTYEAQFASKIGKHIADMPDDLLYRELIEALRPEFRATFENGRRLSHETKVSVGGQDVWFDTRLTPMKDMSGRVKSILGVSREITERKRNEELIALSRREWLRAIDTLPYVMASVDMRHRIEKVNAAMARKLGVTVQGAVGLTCYKHIRGLKTPPPFCPLLQPTQDTAAHRATFTEESNQGRWHITVSSIQDPDGTVVGCLYVGRNADEHSEAAFDKQRRRQIMKQFLAQADHLVLIQDREGRYVFANSVPGNGSFSKELVGKSPHDFFEPDAASRMVERVKRVAGTGLDWTEENEVNFEGVAFTFFDQISAIRDSEGNVKQVVTVSKKVSNNKSLTVSRTSIETGVQELSGREREVLRLIAMGLTNRQIADRLFISKKTVETHRARIMQKLDLHKASALVKYAVESGIV